MNHDHGTSTEDIDRAEFAAIRSEYANLLAAARATLTATIDGDPNPLAYLVDELAAQGQLPPQVQAHYGSDPLAPWLDHRDGWSQ
jgi:hypothetical protein